MPAGVATCALLLAPFDRPLLFAHARGAAAARAAALACGLAGTVRLVGAMPFAERQRLRTAIASGELLRLERAWAQLYSHVGLTAGARSGASELRALLRGWLLAQAGAFLPAEAPSTARAQYALLLHTHGAHDLAYSHLIAELRARAHEHGLSGAAREAVGGAARARAEYLLSLIHI